MSCLLEFAASSDKSHIDGFSKIDFFFLFLNSIILLLLQNDSSTKKRRKFKLHEIHNDLSYLF